MIIVLRPKIFDWAIYEVICDLKHHCGKQISIGRQKQVFSEMCSKTFHFDSYQSWQPGYRAGHGDSSEKLKTVLVIDFRWRLAWKRKKNKAQIDFNPLLLRTRNEERSMEQVHVEHLALLLEEVISYFSLPPCLILENYSPSP